MSPRTTSKLNKSIILKSLGGVFIVSLLGIFFLPAILSSDMVSGLVKQTINDKSPGKIDFEKVSFSWQNGMYLQGVVYDNQAEGITFTARKIATEKGLLALARNYKSIGQVTITEPTTYIHLQEVDTTPSTEVKATQEPKVAGETESSPQSDSEQTVQNTEAKPNTIAVPQIEGTLIISRGTVIVISENKTEKPVVTALDLQATVVSQSKSLDYQIHFLDADGSGKVDGGGTITLPVEGDNGLNQLQTQATLDIENWEIRDLLSILARNANTPTGSGILTSQLTISGSVDSAFKIQGNVTGSDINLQGGGLKSDTPSFDKIVLEVDITKTSSTLAINTLRLNSSLIAGAVSGGIGTDDNAEIKGEANLDLALIFKQFPATLSLQEGISVSDGKINITAKLNGTKTATLFDTRAQLKNLQGVAADKKISWDQPITVEMKGEQGEGGLKFEHFEAKSSFLYAQGKGSSEQIEFNLTADLGAALKEFKKFIKLDGWNSSGKVNLDLRASKDTKTTYPIDGTMNVQNFVLQYKDRPIAPKDSLTLKLSSIMHVDENIRPLHISATSFQFQTWLGIGSATINQLAFPTENTGLSFEDLVMQGSFDLEPLSTSLQALQILPPQTTLGGKTTVVSQLSLSKKKLDLNKLTVEARDFRYQKGKQKIQEKNVQLTAHGSADLKKKSALIQSASLKTAAGHVTFPELTITNWDQLDRGIRTKATADIELGELATLLGDFIDIPDDIRIAGKAALKFEIDLTKIEEQKMEILASVKPLAIGSRETLLSEDSVDFTIDLTGNATTQTYSLRKMDFTTVPVSLNATGGLATEGKKKLLNAQGAMQLNLEILSKQLLSLLGIALEMKGESHNPFSVRAQSNNGRWGSLQNISEFSTSFSAESITGHGLHIQSLVAPINLKDGLGTIDIQGQLNGGKLSLQPTLNFTEETSILSLPDNSNLITEVELTEDMSDDIMAKVHPLFKGAAVSEGTVDLLMNTFSWPLTEAGGKNATFTGEFIFHDVKLKASGILLPLLALMKVDEQEITLSDEPMTFNGENQRITCSPLAILTKNYSIILTGSVGFDQTLDYVAKIPVTIKMVGRDAFKYLEGTFITVPIGGTVSKPAVSKNVMQDALKDLMKQAGTKEITNQAGKLLQKLFQ